MPAHILVVSVQQIELNQASSIPWKQGGDSVCIRERDIARRDLIRGRDGGRARGGTVFLQWAYRYDIRGVRKSKWRSGKGLASSQATRDTKVAHFSPQSEVPRRGSNRRDRPGLLDNANVDIVPAIINRSSWDGIGVYGRDAEERERESQREESDHRGYFPCRTDQ